jgi:phosphate transport system substrate-binding protein
MKLNRNKTFVGLFAALVACMAFTVGTGTASAAVTPALTGSGSTLVAPLMAEWNTRLGGGITYGGGGSGKGITDIGAGTTDFGASDAPMTAAQAAGCAGCVTIPWALSAAGVVANVPGVTGLKLTPSVIAGIFRGSVTTWNDPRITKLNPHKTLPALKITPIHRVDGSGTTYAFTDFLSAAVPTFKSAVGAGTLVSWPVGPGASGSGGVANAAKADGAIAYIGIDYIIPNGLAPRVVSVQNPAGKFVFPNLANIKAAAATVTKVPKSNVLHIVNPKAPKKATKKVKATYAKAYPISTFTYVITKKGSPKAAGLKQLIDFALGAGRGLRGDLGFAPVPDVVAKAGKTAASKL